MKLIFAPKATASLTRQFFPPRKQDGRTWWFIGSPGCLLFVVLPLFLTLCCAVGGVFVSCVAVVWAAQLVVLVTAGPVVLARATS